jgi:hypothetical protein
MTFAGAFAVSLLSYFAIYTYLLPKALVREPVYFDYSSTPLPTAKLSLLSMEKQWYYVGTKRLSSTMAAPEVKAVRRFLHPGSRYSIDLSFSLAKSPRNLNLGKFMVYLTMVDSGGDSIAKSTRPVPIPYQSATSLFLDSWLKFPLRLLGFYQLEETSAVRVTVMNDYREPISSGGSTEVVEIQLSTEAVDVGEVHLTIMPVLGGITYYMHYYPRLSFLVGVSLIMGAQISLFATYLILSIIFKYLSSLSAFLADERQDMDDGEERRYDASVAAGNTPSRRSSRAGVQDNIDVRSTHEQEQNDDGGSSDGGESLSSTWRMRSRSGDDSEGETGSVRITPSSVLRRRSAAGTPTQ